ncbi:MAG: hypothetical protein DCF16_11445 [Alphaproteobacteria bacterium]|nr:MAG: hypothetical protein DCF16_11445 [Alphaproteobacteria bacterium]
MTATPPTREPLYFDNESHGWTLDQCARGLLWTLWGFVYSPRDFKGSANGHAWIAHHDENNARIAFTSDKGDGHVQLSTHESHWVKIEVFVSGALIFRAWADEPYEEKEFWPDGADGIVPPDGDPPGRISKRGSWLQLRRAAFGLPEAESDFWDIELVD